MANLDAPFVLMYKAKGVPLKHMLKHTFKPYGFPVRSAMQNQGQEVPSEVTETQSMKVNQ